MVMNEMAHYEVKADGKVVIWMGTQGMGQGLQTSFTQLASELLGIDASQIEIAMGDSDKVGGVGSMGSRSAYIGGSAVLSGSEKLVDKGKELAADALEASTADIVYAGGRFTITGTDRGIGLGELAAKQPDKRIFIENVNTVDGIAWPNGAHVGEVEIDPETGDVTLKRYTTVDDVGRPLHRPIVFGQIHGGCAQGIGQALLEENVYDREIGPAHHRLVHGLRHAAGDDLPDLQQPARRQRAGQDQPARRQGRGRIGRGRLDADGDERDHGCAVAARHSQHPDAGDAVARMVRPSRRPASKRQSDEATHLRLDLPSHRHRDGARPPSS